MRALRHCGLVLLWAASCQMPGRSSPSRWPALRRPQGRLHLDIRDADTGEPIPAKLVFRKPDGRKPPPFSTDDRAADLAPGVMGAFDYLVTSRGHVSLDVPQGRYEVTVARGPAYEIQVLSIEVGPGLTQLATRLRRAVQAPGWIGCDFHVHAAPSHDSSVALRHRVLSLLGEGLDCFAGSDHDRVTDYGPTLRELGVESQLRWLRADEVSPSTVGHFNVVGLPERAGPPSALVALSPARLFTWARRASPDAFVQVNHPRSAWPPGYFRAFRIENDRPTNPWPGFSWRFDALELLNGMFDAEADDQPRVYDDWIRMLRRGRLVTGTGNSDSHDLRREHVGYPRNWVNVGLTDLDDVDAAVVRQAVARHAVVVSSGPLVLLEANGVGLGGLARAPSGSILARVRVLAPAWVDVSRVELRQERRVVRQWLVTPGASGQRLDAVVRTAAGRDTFLLVRVWGERSLWPVVGSRSDRARPMAITNPVFIDADGDGRWTPPLR